MGKLVNNLVKMSSEAPGVVEINALCEEARKRGMSYGTFVSATTAAEQRKIIDKYRKEHRL